MLNRYAAACLLGWMCIAVVFGFAGACSPGHHKADADKEVYNIINSKWQDSFGHKANYTISDVPPSPNDIQFEKLAPDGVINLVQAAAIATACSRDYQGQKEALYLSALDLTLMRHGFARTWFATVDAGYERDSEDESISYGVESGFSQLLASGAQISTSIATDWVRFLTGDPRTSLGSVLSASLTQPLLRGRGRKVVQENLTQSERNVLYQIRSFNRYRKSFVVSIVDGYYRVLQRRDQVTNALNNYNRLQESQDRLEMEALSGRKPRFEVDQAEQNRLRAWDSYVQAKQTYEQQLDQFKFTMGLTPDVEIELDQNELKALEKAGLTEPDYKLSAAVETALSQRLDLANYKDKIQDAARKIVVAADNLGVELNLIGSASVDSTGKTNYGRLLFHEGTYGLGLQGSLPLDRKAERNAYREALITLTQQQREYDNFEDQVKLDVRRAYRQLQEAAERYKIQLNSLQLAEKRVESTTLLLDAGRSTTRDLLESQDALLQAQNNVTAALVDHAVAKLDFFRDVGILQVRPDGMWQEEGK